MRHRRAIITVETHYANCIAGSQVNIQVYIEPQRKAHGGLIFWLGLVRFSQARVGNRHPIDIPWSCAIIFISKDTLPSWYCKLMGAILPTFGVTGGLGINRPLDLTCMARLKVRELHSSIHSYNIAVAIGDLVTLVTLVGIMISNQNMPRCFDGHALGPSGEPFTTSTSQNQFYQKCYRPVKHV